MSLARFVSLPAAAVLAMSLAGAPAADAATIADFDTTFLVPTPNEDLSVGGPGCSLFTGATGSALCGSDIRVGTNGGPVSLGFTGNLARGGRLTFDLAATAFGNANADLDPTDFFRVTVDGSTVFELNGNDVLAGGTGLNPLTGLTGNGLFVNNTFQTISLILGPGSATAAISLQFFTTNATEYVGIDQIEFSPIPVPAGLPLLLGALAGFAFLRRRA